MRRSQSLSLTDKWNEIWKNPCKAMMALNTPTSLFTPRNRTNLISWQSWIANVEEMLGSSPEEWECTVPDRLVCRISQMRCESWTNHLMQVKSFSLCHPDNPSQWGKQESRRPLWPKHKSFDQHNLLPIKGLNEIICLRETEIPRLLAEPIHHPEPLKSVLLAISQIPGHF